ncbi:dTDP-glucose 4,6-dehydratase [Allonocardiopsis opalescens]|uniref:dTDP-glucose 4,6-dehydratase n=1 Tax=Allonocardiopsis opalescens TaxID=1144618 RepID=A0A2T0Q9I3_9ACTN|nr:dTDP-glucose 4,6-dehydratase [Allonocardiopsis opalescens]PRY00472.1 dTDP-glucose 4,6-dehydratase [Allonocardiopsis opalescens]
MAAEATTRRVLVTGGAGFIGSAYVRMLLADPRQAIAVTVLDKLSYAGNPRNLDPVRADPRLSFVHGSVCDTALVERLLPGHDQVVHFAAESHVDRSLAVPAEFVTTNVGGTQTLLDAALRHGVRTFLHVSTDEVYGSIDTGSWQETEPVAPNSPYSATKAGADLLCLAYGRTHGMDVRITRGSNTYGPFQFPEKIIPLFVTNLVLGRRVPLYGDGLNVRDWLHVEDHCRGIELAVQRGRPGQVYNIGGGTELSNHELTLMILKLLGAGPEMIEPVADRKGHDRRYSVDWAKAAGELGYRPRVGFDDGLRDTVSWYQRNRHWWAPLRDRGPLASPDD